VKGDRLRSGRLRIIVAASEKLGKSISGGTGGLHGGCSVCVGSAQQAHGAEGTIKLGTLHQALLTKTSWSTEGAGASQKKPASLGFGERAVR
jgi:hypothetical protein